MDKVSLLKLLIILLTATFFALFVILRVLKNKNYLVKKYWIFLLMLVLMLLIIFYFAGKKNPPKIYGPDQKNTLQAELNYFFDKAESLGQTQSKKTTVTFLAVGDIMLSRNVAQETENRKDYNFPFAKMPEIFNPAAGSFAFSFGNLESPASPKKAIIGGHSMVFGTEKKYLEALRKNNFKILNLANNHALDQGQDGIMETKKTLTNLGIAHMGAGENLGQAWEPAVVNSGGIKICFIGASYSSVNDNGKTFNNFVARIENLDYLNSALSTAKTICNFNVVTMHAGTEYTRKPNKAQINFARKAIDLGADIVIGAHPHWVQTIEKYCPSLGSHPPLTPPIKEGESLHSSLPLVGKDNCKYIFYSLGNFIFDQNFSQETKEGLTLKISLSKLQTPSPTALEAANLEDLQGARQKAKLDSIELLPVIIENSQPRPATTDETKKILKSIGQTENLLKP